MRGGARNLVNDWYDDSLDDLETFVPVSPKTPTPDNEVRIRKANRKKIATARARVRAIKEELLEADKSESASA